MTTITAETLQATCSCGATIKAKSTKDGKDVKVPRGWKRLTTGDVICKTCKSSRYVPRSVRLRIIGPAEGEVRESKELFCALCSAGNQVSQFANWYVQKLFAADLAMTPVVQKEGGKAKFPALPEVDFYREATKLFPAIAPTAIVQAGQMVRRCYAADRFATIATKDRSVRNYRWDSLPIPVFNQSWKLRTLNTGGVVLTAAVAPGKAWTLAVFADGINLGRVKQLLSGDAEAGAAMFLRRARRPLPGESGPPKRSWYMRISGLFPRVDLKQRKSHKEVTLTLGHDAGGLWFGHLDGESDEVFEYPAVELKQRIRGHQERDRKMQIENSTQRRELSKRAARRRADKRRGCCDKHQAAVTAQLNLACACLVRWCLSHAVTTVKYDVTDRGWIDSFPWYRLRETLRSRLENEGIALHCLDANGKEVGPSGSEEGKSKTLLPSALPEPTSETRERAGRAETSP